MYMGQAAEPFLWIAALPILQLSLTRLKMPVAQCVSQLDRKGTGIVKQRDGGASV